nr:ferredoxin-thioredoxin reductase catalytic chain, chloroplastic [Ipomoea batatas]
MLQKWETLSVRPAPRNVLNGIEKSLITAYNRFFLAESCLMSGHIQILVPGYSNQLNKINNTRNGQIADPSFHQIEFPKASHDCRRHKRSSYLHFLSIGFGISPFSAPPTRSSSYTHGRHVAFATEPSEKSVETMRKFSVHAVCSEVRNIFLHYDDKTAEVEKGFWNCPCLPLREMKQGVPLHAFNFSPHNDFAGEKQTISLEEIRETTATNM